MLPIEYQTTLPYTAGIIQMVPGRMGYEPVYRKDEFGESDLMESNGGARFKRSRLTDEKYETTYTENRRLTSSGASDIGSFIDIYV